jgi:hypothetical protein
MAKQREMVVIRLGGIDFIISSRYAGVEYSGPRNKFKIEVIRPGYPPQKFDFYDSIENFNKGIKELNKKDLLEAFKLIIEDGQLGALSFEEFYDLFGGEESENKRGYKMAKRQLSKLERLGLTPEDLDGILADLGKIGIG